MAGLVTWKKATFEVPPGVGGLSTVTEAVPAVAIREPGTTTRSCVGVIEKGVSTVTIPFIVQFTVAPETKPEPFTVSGSPNPTPGAVLVGTSG